MESVIESVARYAVNANHTYPRQVHTLVLSHRARSCLEFNETEHKENGVRKLIPLYTDSRNFNERSWTESVG